jgi:hypothetical protein
LVAARGCAAPLRVYDWLDYDYDYEHEYDDEHEHEHEHERKRMENQAELRYLLSIAKGGQDGVY